MSPSNTVRGGLGFLPTLALVFIVLRLCEVIAWSWWWVLCPLWGPVALAVALCLTIGLACFVVACLPARKGRGRR